MRLGYERRLGRNDLPRAQPGSAIHAATSLSLHSAVPIDIDTVAGKRPAAILR